MIEWDKRIAWDMEDHPLLKAAEAYLNRPPQPPKDERWTITDRIMKRTLRNAMDDLRARVSERTSLRCQMEHIATSLHAAEEEIEVALVHFAKREQV